MAINWREKIILAKLETTYGTDASALGADALLVKNVQFSPQEGADRERELELAYMGSTGSVPVELHATLNFTVELAPSGTAGVAPAWGKLLRMCGCAETIVADTSVTYNPVSTGHESGTITFFNGTTQHLLLGTRGTARFVLNASQEPMIEVTLTGLYTGPADASRPVPSYAGWQRPQVVSMTHTPTVTAAGVPLVMRTWSLDLGNEVTPRFLVGAESIRITDRAEAVTMDVEAVPLATLDPYGLAETQTASQLSLVHGTGTGKIATFAVPAAQHQRVQGLNENQGIAEWPLRFIPIPQVGNDQWTLTLT